MSDLGAPLSSGSTGGSGLVGGGSSLVGGGSSLGQLSTSFQASLDSARQAASGTGAASSASMFGGAGTTPVTGAQPASTPAAAPAGSTVPTAGAGATPVTTTPTTNGSTPAAQGTTGATPQAAPSPASGTTGGTGSSSVPAGTGTTGTTTTGGATTGSTTTGSPSSTSATSGSSTTSALSAASSPVTAASLARSSGLEALGDLRDPSGSGQDAARRDATRAVQRDEANRKAAEDGAGLQAAGSRAVAAFTALPASVSASQRTGGIQAEPAARSGTGLSSTQIASFQSAALDALRSDRNDRPDDASRAAMMRGISDQLARLPAGSASGGSAALTAARSAIAGLGTTGSGTGGDAERAEVQAMRAAAATLGNGSAARVAAGTDAQGLADRAAVQAAQAAVTTLGKGSAARTAAGTDAQDLADQAAVRAARTAFARGDARPGEQTAAGSGTSADAERTEVQAMRAAAANVRDGSAARTAPGTDAQVLADRAAVQAARTAFARGGDRAAEGKPAAAGQPGGTDGATVQAAQAAIANLAAKDSAKIATGTDAQGLAARDADKAAGAKAAANQASGITAAAVASAALNGKTAAAPDSSKAGGTAAEAGAAVDPSSGIRSVVGKDGKDYVAVSVGPSGQTSAGVQSSSSISDAGSTANGTAGVSNGKTTTAGNQEVWVPKDTVLGQALLEPANPEGMQFNFNLPNNWAHNLLNSVVEKVEGGAAAVNKFVHGTIEEVKNDWNAMKTVGNAIKDTIKAGVEGAEGITTGMLGSISGIEGMGDFSKQLLEQAKTDIGNAGNEALLGTVMMTLHQNEAQAKETIGKFALLQDVFALGGSDPTKKEAAESRLSPFLKDIDKQLDEIQSNDKTKDPESAAAQDFSLQNASTQQSNSPRWKIDTGLDVSGSKRFGADGYGLSVQQIRAGGVFTRTDAGWSAGFTIKLYDQVGVALPASSPVGADLSLMGSRDVTFSKGPDGTHKTTHTSSLSIFGEASFDERKTRAATEALIKSYNSLSEKAPNVLPFITASADDPTSALGSIFDTIESADRYVNKLIHRTNPSDKLEAGLGVGLYTRKDLTGTDFKTFVVHVLAPELAGAAVGGLGGTALAYGADLASDGYLTPYIPMIGQFGADIGVFVADLLSSPSFQNHETGLSVNGWLYTINRQTGKVFEGSPAEGTVSGGTRVQVTRGQDFPFPQ